MKSVNGESVNGESVNGESVNESVNGTNGTNGSNANGEKGNEKNQNLNGIIINNDYDNEKLITQILSKIDELNQKIIVKNTNLIIQILSKIDELNITPIIDEAKIDKLISFLKQRDIKQTPAIYEKLKRIQDLLSTS